MLHLGTECKSFSKASKYDGRAPPIRCQYSLKPLSSCNAEQKASVEIGSRLAEISFDLAGRMCKAQAFWTLEKSWRHKHIHLEGQILHPLTNELTWRTSLAQEYPTELVHTHACAALCRGP